VTETSEREGLRTSNSVHGWSTMNRITEMRSDLQAESSVWLFKSPLAGGGGILWRPHYRPQLVINLFLQDAHNTNMDKRCLL